MLAETDVSHLLSRFPNVEFAFAYGSGVVQQEGYDYNKKDNFPMLDVILVVENSEMWHQENMSRNPDDYSSLIPLSPKYTAFIQDKFAANFWFNAYIPMNSNRFPGRLMKYGVISRENMLKDLDTWNHLYVAGRLHKPVHIIKSNHEIELALNRNLDSALRTSLLLLPNQFSEFDLFVSVASLSYIGDPRMFIGENPRKVVNLVTPIVQHYRTLYQSSFDKISIEAKVLPVDPTFWSSSSSFSMPSFDASAASGVSINNKHTTTRETFSHMYTQDTSAASRWNLSVGLPKTLRNLLAMENRSKYMHGKPPKPAAIRSALSTIVARSAGMQTVKGLFTVGVLKSSSYLLAKMKKRFSSAPSPAAPSS